MNKVRERMFIRRLAAWLRRRNWTVHESPSGFTAELPPFSVALYQDEQGAYLALRNQDSGKARRVEIADFTLMQLGSAETEIKSYTATPEGAAPTGRERRTKLEPTVIAGRNIRHETGNGFDGAKITTPLLALLQRYPPECAVRRQSRDIDEALDHIENLLERLHQLKRWPEERGLSNISSQARGISNSIEAGTATDEDLTDELDQIRKTLSEYLLWQSTESEERKITRIIHEKHTVLQDAENLLNNLRDATANLAIHKNAAYFSTLANSQKRAAYYWLVATTLFAALAALAAIFLPLGAFTDAKDAPLQSLHWLTTIRSTFLISLPTSAALWCARAYRATSHNRLVNIHRSNAISTFELFAAHGDNETKSMVLQRATDAVFAHLPTGFGPKESKGSETLIGIANDLTKRPPSA